MRRLLLMVALLALAPTDAAPSFDPANSSLTDNVELPAPSVVNTTEHLVEAESRQGVPNDESRVTKRKNSRKKKKPGQRKSGIVVDSSRHVLKTQGGGSPAGGHKGGQYAQANALSSGAMKTGIDIGALSGLLQGPGAVTLPVGVPSVPLSKPEEGESSSLASGWNWLFGNNLGGATPPSLPEPGIDILPGQSLGWGWVPTNIFGQPQFPDTESGDAPSDSGGESVVLGPALPGGLGTELLPDGLFPGALPDDTLAGGVADPGNLLSSLIPSASSGGNPGSSSTILGAVPILDAIKNPVGAALGQVPGQPLQDVIGDALSGITSGIPSPGLPLTPGTALSDLAPKPSYTEALSEAYSDLLPSPGGVSSVLGPKPILPEILPGGLPDPEEVLSAIAPRPSYTEALAENFPGLAAQIEEVSEAIDSKPTLTEALSQAASSIPGVAGASPGDVPSIFGTPGEVLQPEQSLSWGWTVPNIFANPFSGASDSEDTSDSSFLDALIPDALTGIITKPAAPTTPIPSGISNIFGSLPSLFGGVIPKPSVSGDPPALPKPSSDTSSETQSVGWGWVTRPLFGGLVPGVSPPEDSAVLPKPSESSIVLGTVPFMDALINPDGVKNAEVLGRPLTGDLSNGGGILPSLLPEKPALEGVPDLTPEGSSTVLGTVPALDSLTGGVLPKPEDLLTALAPQASSVGGLGDIALPSPVKPESLAALAPAPSWSDAWADSLGILGGSSAAAPLNPLGPLVNPGSASAAIGDLAESKPQINPIWMWGWLGGNTESEGSPAAPTASKVMVVFYPRFVATIGQGIGQVASAVKDFGRNISNQLTSGLSNVANILGTGVKPNIEDCDCDDSGKLLKEGNTRPLSM